MESSISTNPRYRDKHKDNRGFLSNIFMAYISETQSLSKTV